MLTRVPTGVLLAFVAVLCGPASDYVPALRHVQSAALLALVVLVVLDERARGR